ncbi:MAG: ATP-binding protein [Treponema sp.]|jgi:hypothetical protein|nr:ATP-binding protein [Treponema sp.]
MNDIPKRISTAILNSLSAGVVPRIGLEYIAVGRKRELETILRDLENLGQGASVFRFITGRYGSGKSFFLQAVRNYAMENNFLTADADLSPEKRLSGSNRAGLETYRELAGRLSTKLRPDGGALEPLLQRWINSIRTELARDGAEPGGGAGPPAGDFSPALERRIFETLAEMEEMAHGYDFAAAVACYYRAFAAGDDERQNAALRWLRGEFSTRTEARAFFPAGEIITDDNWYGYLKLLGAFASRTGYRGLLVFIDEGVNLYKITNRQSREKNYERLLTMFNDAMQGKTERMGIYMSGTPRFIEDERRGLASYPALKSRLEDNRFAREGYSVSESPVLKLAPLAREEIHVLLERLRDIHAGHWGYESSLGGREIEAFIDLAFSVPGAEEFITPREIARDFLGLLGILRDDPRLSFDTMVYRDGYRVKGSPGDPGYAEFET